MTADFIKLNFIGTTGTATMEIDARSVVKKIAPDRHWVGQPGQAPRVYYLTGSSISARGPLPGETYDALPDLSAPKGLARNP
ncbi:hypothetical protein [Brevundimonas sp.]|uniref:hypothetical protein n=1 Tax=Brevundimonas sp. TaxID=1871086 RepID=UPI00289AF3D2|nr:hypothetical protein [Brevundimonas sp.]